MKSPSCPDDWLQPWAGTNLVLARSRVSHLEKTAPLMPLISVCSPKQKTRPGTYPAGAGWSSSTIVSTALGAVWAGQGEGGNEVRLSVERLADGRVELGLQHREDDGSWSQTRKPRHRFLAPDAVIGKPLYSDPLTLRIPDRVDEAAGVEAAYIGAVERIEIAGWDALRALLESRVARAIHEIDVPIAAFGFNVGLASSVIEGTVIFTILDHSEMQAYLSTVASVMADRWRLDPVAYFNGMSLLIRPQIADAKYMQALVDSMFEE